MKRFLLILSVSAIWVAFDHAPASAQGLIAWASSSAPTAAAKSKSIADRAPAGTTRVAVINLGYVFNKYERAGALKDEMQVEVNQLKEQAKRELDNLTVLQQAIQKNEFKNGTKEQYDEKLILGRRRLEDLQRKAQVKFGKQSQHQLVILWSDVRDAVKAYTAEHHIDLVLSYGDPLEPTQIDAFPNLERKMRSADAGAFVPFLVNPGADISEAVTELLNRRYREGLERAAGDDPR